MANTYKDLNMGRRPGEPELEFLEMGSSQSCSWLHHGYEVFGHVQKESFGRYQGLWAATTHEGLLRHVGYGGSRVEAIERAIERMTSDS